MENCDENTIPEKKRKCFCPITFREEIKGRDVLKSLKKFISAAQGTDDVILEYLNNGGSVSEILSLIDASAKGDLTTALPVFEIILLIFLRFQAVDSEYHKQCIDGSKNILQSHILTIQSMLSMNISKHRKVALKLLSAIVTLNSSFANEIINTFLPSSQLITNLIQPSPEKESVRKHFILFVLSFVLEGNPTVLKNIISNKGFLTSIFPGLKFDDVDTVIMVLSLVQDKILKNPKISKTLKLKVFNTQTIKSLFDLFDWKGLQGIKELTAIKNKAKIMEINSKEKNLVVDHVQSFLILLCTSTKYGIAFQDKSLGLSDTLNNQLLYSVIETLSNPLSDNKLAEVLLKVLVNCPDLLKPTLIKLEPFFQPRSSKNWFEAVEFAENLIKELNAVHKLKSDGEFHSATYILKVVKTLCAPLVLLKTAKLGFNKDQTFDTRIASLRLLATMWNEICKLKNAFLTDQPTVKKGINGYLSKFVPEPDELVQLWYNLCDKECIRNFPSLLENIASNLSIVLEVLQMAVESQKEKISGHLSLVNDLLSHFDQLKDEIEESENLNKVQVKIIHLVESDLSSLTPDKQLFQRAIQILLQNDDDLSLSCSSKILSNLTIFKTNKAEIDVWLQCFINLPLEYRPAVCNFIINSIVKNYKMNYLGNVEIDTETNDLDKAEEELLTPFIDYCIENFMSSDSNKASQEVSFYLKDLLVHLQHYYPENNEFLKYVKPLKNLLGKSFAEYLKNWSNNTLKSDNLEVISCPIERKLISWILNEEDKRSIDAILNSDLDFLKLNQSFRTLTAYLVKKTTDNTLNEINILKFSDSLSYFLKINEYLEESEEYIISQKLKNFSVFFNACTHCIFSNKTFLKAFDIFTKKNGKCCSEIIVKALMSNKNIRKKAATNSTIEIWKSKFLRQLKAKLKKNKSLQSVDSLEAVLNFFQFHHSDIVEMIEGLICVSDLTLFLHGDSPSKWTLVFVKFLQLHCLNAELDKNALQKLCDLVKYLNDVGCSDLRFLDSCFEFLLKIRPNHLMLIENDFINIILSRPYSMEAAMVGKLLINDPTKVKYFLSVLPKYLRSDLILPMLSVLFVESNEFIEAINSEQSCLIWKASKISENSPFNLFKKLKIVYENYEENILRALSGEKESIILNNIAIVKILINLFIEKDVIKKTRKKFFKGEFQPELLFEAIKKLNLVDLIDTFIKELLKRFCKLIKSSKDFEENFWEKHYSLLVKIIQLRKSSSGIVDKSPEWNEFFKLALGLCLSCSKYPSLMKIIRLLISAQQAEDSKSMGFYFQMIISHSQFLNTIFGHSTLKDELIYLLEVLICRCKSEMSVKQIPILLASYTCSMSTVDRTILNILKYYETSGFSLAEYEPLVWGESAISHYSIGTTSKLFLWQRFSMMNILDMLDVHKMETSLDDFPIYRSLEDNNVPSSDSDSDIYDPAFLLPLFVSFLSPGSLVYPLPFVYKGGLAFTIRALSSESCEMRSMASVVLNRFYNHLELTQNLKQKMVWMHFINGFRYGIKDLSTNPVPNIITLFFAKMTLEVSQNSFEMYLPLQKFLLAKPHFSFTSIPEFLPLFHSSEVHHKKHRHWLLNILKNGTKTSQDLSIIFYSMAFKVIFCFFQSQLCDIETKKLILQALEKFMDAKKSELLISEYGLINWIKSIDFNAHSAILPDLIKLLFKVSNVVIERAKKNDGKFSSLGFVIQILNISMGLLPSLCSVKSKETFFTYLKIIYNCSILFINKKNMDNDWFKFNKAKVENLIKCGTDILNVEDNYSKFCKLPFYFRDFNEDSDNEIIQYFKNVIYLFNLLSDKPKK